MLKYIKTCICKKNNTENIPRWHEFKKSRKKGRKNKGRKNIGNIYVGFGFTPLHFTVVDTEIRVTDMYIKQSHSLKMM